MMKRYLLYLLFFIVVCQSLAYAIPTHLDKSAFQIGCSECHKGHGEKGTQLLSGTKEELCFSCHSLTGKASNLYSEFAKLSSHPIIETAQYHAAGEDLPERNPSTPRHVSCYDCHNVHKSEKGKAIKGLRGYNGKSHKIKKIRDEHELCYNCHSDSANLNSSEDNIALDFDPSNPSYHPVERHGRNSSMPSLQAKHSAASRITCSDCHGNDDPMGPEGPHGSVYEPILKKRYTKTSGSESPNAYALCYDCHDRNSILRDESFRAHKAHVVYNQISCAQCHDAHGSRMNSNLIEFDNSVVFPTELGELSYMPLVPGRPQCFLSCHTNGQQYEHRTSATFDYCINDKCSSDW